MTHSKTAAKYCNRVGGAVCIHFAMLFVVQIIFLLILAVAVAVSRKDISLSNFITSKPVTLYGVAVAYVSSNIICSIIALAFCSKLKNSFKGMFAAPDISGKTMLLCIPAAMFIQSVSIVIQNVFSGITGSSGMENMQMPELIHGHTLNNIVYVLYVVLLGPITEELIFRGAFMKCLNFAGRNFAIFFSAFLFALFHGNIMQGIIAFLLGIFFGYLDMKTGSLIPSVILHITNNLIAALFEIIEFAFGIDMSGTILTIYLIASIVLGALCMFLVLKNLKPKDYTENEFFAPEFTPEPDEKKSCRSAAALKDPLMWIACFIYVALIIVIL